MCLVANKRRALLLLTAAWVAVAGVVGAGVMSCRTDKGAKDGQANQAEQGEPDGPADTLVDPRDGQKYRTVRIGGRVWMAENLNHQSSSGNSWCYEGYSFRCVIYGRLYDWDAAKTVCPSGWHLPSDAEWSALVIAVGSPAGTMLKSKIRWNDGGNGTDDYGFSALPGGYCNSGGGFDDAGDDGRWWTAPDSFAHYYWRMVNNHGYLIRSNIMGSGDGYSVRCVKDGQEGLAGAFANIGEKRCGDVGYNPKTQFCYKYITFDVHPDAGIIGEPFGTFDVDTQPLASGTHPAYEGGVFDKCGGEEYNPRLQSCDNGKIKNDAECGNEGYDPEKHFCHKGKIFELCGGGDYLRYYLSNDSLHRDRGTGRRGQVYNPETQFCADFCGCCYLPEDSVEDKCDGREYDGRREFCYGDRVFERCGGMASCDGPDGLYDPEKHSCDDGNIIDKAQDGAHE